MDTQIKNSILATFVCDAYCLGAHWVYDEKELAKLPLDWESLNAAQSLWHKGKLAGEFIHYGDQALYLLEFVVKNKSFNQADYYAFWSEKMSSYDGYIDGSTRESLKNIGAPSQELSICGRIAPLLLCSNSKEEFLENVTAFVSTTHNSSLALNASAFFAELLWGVKEGGEIFTLINQLKPKYEEFGTWIDEAIAKKDENSFDTIREFGPACGIDGGFAGVIYLLLQEKDFKSVMIENAKAGGDSSARGMVVAMIMGMNKEINIPIEWTQMMKKYTEITTLFMDV